MSELDNPLFIITDDEKIRKYLGDYLPEVVTVDITLTEYLQTINSESEKN